MELTPTQQNALSRWHDLGAITPTHPVLQYAYELYYQPLGVSCDVLEYDALAALDNPERPIILRSPRWQASRADRSWSQYSVIEPLVALSDKLQPTFAANGSITEFKLLQPNLDSAPEIIHFTETQAQPIFELSDSLAAAAKLYIQTSLELMIQPQAVSEEFAKLWLENPRRFAVTSFEAFIDRNPQR